MSTRVFAPDLPQEALVRILQAVEQEDRLCSCALVCSTWATAAGAVTTDVLVGEGRLNSKTADSLTRWLQQHGRRLEVLTVGPGKCSLRTMHRLQLPCSLFTRLRVLQLHNCKVQLQFGSNGGSNGLLLPSLQALSLRRVDTRPDSLATLLMPKLTHLELSEIPYSTSQAKDVIPTLLESLPQLLELEVAKLHVDDAALEPLTNLQHLQSCTIRSCPNISPQVLSGLCSSLTALTFAPDFDTGHSFLLEDVPEAGWPRLKVWRMFHTPLQPAVLASLTDLQVLDLWECALLPSEEVEEVHGMEQDAAGASELLSALSQLTHLKKLELCEINLQALDDLSRAAWQADLDAVDFDAGPFRDVQHLQQYSALTASDELESLVLCYRDEDPPELQPLPRYCFENLFPEGRQLLHLTELVLDGLCTGELEGWVEYVQDGDSEDEDDTCEARQQRDPWLNHWCVDPMELDAMRDACPNLPRLTLNSVMPSEYECLQASITAITPPEAQTLSKAKLWGAPER